MYYKLGDFIEKARSFIEKTPNLMSIPGGDSLYCMIDAIDRGQPYHSWNEFHKRACAVFKKEKNEPLPRHLGCDMYYA